MSLKYKFEPIVVGAVWLICCWTRPALQKLTTRILKVNLTSKNIVVKYTSALIVSRRFHSHVR